jgi:hypothetical protein
MRQGTRPIHDEDDPCEEAAEPVEEFIEEYADRQKQIGEMLEQPRRLTEQSALRGRSTCAPVRVA